MERSVEVRTGEAIAVRYELAGLGSRFLALMIDLTIQSAVVVAALLILIVAGVTAGPIVAGLRGAPGIAAIVIALLILAAFTLFFGYFIIFELAWNGRTPGKRALGIRVVRDAGFPIDVGAAVMRNCVRVLEAGLGFYACSALVMLLSPENKRLGDYAAGTIVVRDAALATSSLEELLATEPARDDGLELADRVLIDRFLERRATLAPDARSALALRIADRVRPKLRAAFAHLDDEALLEHLGRP